MTQKIKSSTRFGFTLIELMVAVVVLLVVMIAVGRIFSTTSDMTASGRATSETLQQAIAIEQRFREDIAKISHDGFFAIRSVAIANNAIDDYVLLDDSMESDAILRFDQLVFFTLGISSPTLIQRGSGIDFSGQGAAAMVYYGHGIRLPKLLGVTEGVASVVTSDDLYFFDGTSGTPLITPWYQGAVQVQTHIYSDGYDNGRFDPAGSVYPSNGTQPLPADWMLCRQLIVLGDDDGNSANDNSKTAFQGNGISTKTLFPWDPRIDNSIPFSQVLDGRVDMAASQFEDIRESVLQLVEHGEGVDSRPWRVESNGDYVDQQELIASLFRWPRVEPYPDTTHRYDQILMNSGLAQGCVSFQIEWTYDEGVGEVTGENWVSYTGYQYDDALVQPWWGSSYRENDGTISFNTLKYWTEYPEEGDVPAQLVNPDNIEPIFNIGEGPLYAPVPTVQDQAAEYWAIFGYNGHDPLHPDWVYTPRPSALRITLRLQDRENRLGAGWTYQFIVDLPGQK